MAHTIVVIYNKGDLRQRCEFVARPLARLLADRYPDMAMAELHCKPGARALSSILRELFSRGVSAKTYIYCGSDMAGMLWAFGARLRGAGIIFRLGGNQLTAFAQLARRALVEFRPSAALKYLANYAATRLSLIYAHGVISVCEYLTEELRSQGSVPYRIPIFTVPQILRGIPDGGYPLDHAYPRERGTIRLLTVTNLRFRKKFTPLMDLVRMGLEPSWAPPEGLSVEYDFVVGGPYASEFKREVEALGPALMERGIHASVHCNASDVSPWLLRADLFLYASQEDYVPNSIIEAQGRGLPLVVNDFAGLRALLAEGRNARFFRSGSPADAASTVSGLLADAHSMRTMAMANRDDTASTYSAPAIMERLIPLVEFVRNRSTSDA